MSADKITPRTDALRIDLSRDTFAVFIEMREHARQLERELAALRAQLAERDAENSKLRSALEIVHFKQEPWQ